MCVCCIQLRCCLYSQSVDLAFLSVTGSGQISAHLQNNSPEEKLSSQHAALISFCLSSSPFFLTLPDSPVSDPDRDPPELLYSALPLPFLFQFLFSNLICLFLYHALCKNTLWVGASGVRRFVTNSYTLVVHAFALTLTCMCACMCTHTHRYIYGWHLLHWLALLFTAPSDGNKILKYTDSFSHTNSKYAHTQINTQSQELHQMLYFLPLCG